MNICIPKTGHFYVSPPDNRKAVYPHAHTFARKTAGKVENAWGIC